MGSSAAHWLYQEEQSIIIAPVSRQRPLNHVASIKPIFTELLTGVSLLNILQ